MKKSLYKNLGRLLCIVVCVYCIDRLWLMNTILPVSIDSVHLAMTRCVRHWRVIVVAFMPVYVALFVFGACVFGNSFGSTAQRWLSRLFFEKQ